jgi:PleD family two-component response regulator
MPNKNGFDTCQHIKNTTRFKHAPILMMTGLEDELSITTSYEVGATDFIQKPFNFNLFIQRLRYINRNAQMTRELIESRRRIQQAQEIAKLAYWEWDIQNQKFNWSDSIFEMLDIEPDIDKNNINLLLEHTTHEDKSSLDRWLNTAVSGEAVGGISHQINTKNGSILYAYQQLKQQFDESGKLSHLYGAIVDVTEVQKAQEQIRQLAYFDELTKLPNRAYFTDSLTKSIQLSLNQNQLGAIILL